MNVGTLLAFVVLAILADILVLLHFGRWNLANLLTPTRFLLVMMVVLLQWPAILTSRAPHLAGNPGVMHGLIASALAPGLVVLGAVLAGRPSMPWKEWWRQPFLYVPSQARLLKVFVGFVALGIVIQIVAVGSLAGVPLVANILNPGQGAYLRDIREQAFKLQPLYFRYPIALSREFVSYFAVAGIVVLKHLRLLGWGWVVLAVGLGIINAGMQGAKAPPTMVLLAAGIGYLLIRGARFRPAYIIGGMVGLSLFPLLLTLARFSISPGQGLALSDIVYAYELLWQRLFYAPSRMVLQYFAYSPEVSGGFYYGRTIHLFARAIGEESVPLPWLVAQFYGENVHETAFANAGFYADAWANFGWAGIVLICLFVGWFLGLIEQLVASGSRPSILGVGTLVAATVGVTVILSIPATSWLAGGGGLLVFIMAVLTRLSNARYSHIGHAPPLYEAADPSHA